MITSRAKLASLNVIAHAEKFRYAQSSFCEIERHVVIVNMAGTIGLARVKDIVNVDARMKGFTGAATISNLPSTITSLGNMT
jgi:hypothetical protein